MSKHYKGSYRAVRENYKLKKRPAKMCEDCQEECTHYGIGELRYCWRFKPKKRK